MTPKERLKRLESYSVCDNYREKEEDFREIEKALEVLEILKKNIKIENCKQDEKEHTCIFMLILDNEENYNFIEEWLENGK